MASAGISSYKHPIFEAAKFGTADDVKVAMRRNVGPKDKEKLLEIRDREHRTPLHVACLYNNNSVIMVLVQHGFDYDAPDPYLATPLMYSVRAGFVPLLDHVIELCRKEEEEDKDDEADKAKEALLRTDISGANLLHYCFDAGAAHPDLKAKKSGRKRHSSEPSTNTPDRKLEIAKKLVDIGVPLNKADNQMKAVLNYALINKYNECVPYLLSKGACVSDITMKALSILHWKILYPKDKDESLEEYLSFAKVDSQDRGGRTPLHYAAALSAPETKTSVDGDSDQSDKTFYQNQGRREFRLACANILITNNCNVNGLDFSGRTPLQLALEVGFEEMVELLLSKGGRLRGTSGNFAGILHFESCLLWSSISERDIKSRHPFYVEKYKVKVDELDDSGRTALHYTCFASDVLTLQPGSFVSDKGRICGVEALLSLGADINARDDQGYTTLMYAVQNKLLDVVSLLIERGANTMIQNNVKLTAFNFAEGCGDRATQFLNVLKGTADGIKKDNIFEQCYKSLTKVASVLENDKIIPEAKRTACLQSVKQAEEQVSTMLKDSELQRRLKLQREILESRRDMLCDELMPPSLFAKLRQER